MAIFNGYISHYQREGLEFLMVSAQDTDFIDEKMGYFELKGGFRRPSCRSVVGFKWLGGSPIRNHPHERFTIGLKSLRRPS